MPREEEDFQESKKTKIDVAAAAVEEEEAAVAEEGVSVQTCKQGGWECVSVAWGDVVWAEKTHLSFASESKVASFDSGRGGVILDAELTLNIDKSANSSTWILKE